MICNQSFLEVFGQILPKNFDYKSFSESENITIAVRERNSVVDFWPGLVEKIYGVSIDIGSTTLAVNLSDLQTGEVLASEGLQMRVPHRFEDH